MCEQRHRHPTVLGCWTYTMLSMYRRHADLRGNYKEKSFFSAVNFVTRGVLITKHHHAVTLLARKTCIVRDSEALKVPQCVFCTGILTFAVGRNNVGRALGSSLGFIDPTPDRCMNSGL